jgi:putative FmdB family regulatory protein
MPFYEYECEKCGYRDEVLQKISDKPLKKCPSCGKPGLKKLMSAPVFRLKGSGWYETDFKSDKENKRNLVGSEKDEPKAEAKSDAKSDTKPEAKSEAKPESKPEVAKPAGKSAGRSTGKPGKSPARSRKAAPARKGRR